MVEPGDRSHPSPGASRRGGPASFWRAGHAALLLVFGSPLAFFVLCILAFMAAFFLQVGLDLQQLAFLVSRGPRLWHVFFALQSMFHVAAILIVWGELRSPHSLWPGTWRERMAVMFCSVIAFVMTSLPFVAQFMTWPADPTVNELGLTSFFGTRGLVISTIGVVVEGLLSLSLFCVHVQLLGQLADPPAHGNQRGAGGLEQEVLRYLGARSRLSRILSLAAWHLGITLLAIGILRNLLNDAFPARPELFPARVVVGFGFYFTAYLAIIYLPIRRTLAKVGEALADRLIQQTLGAHATWKERFHEQQVARTYLGLQESAFQEFQQGLSVLSPLLASLSTLALGAGV